MKALILSIVLLLNFAYAEETTHEVLPIADTYVTSDAENRNYGGESLLDLKTYYAGTRLLIKFDKNQIKNLLTNKDLVSARLELPIQNHYVKIEGQIGLFKMNVDWTENGATWKCPIDTDTSNWNQDCQNPWLMWSHDPNNTIPYPYDLSPFATGTIVGDQATPVGFNIEGYVNDLISGNIANNYGFAVYKISTNINDPLAFYSRESDVGPKIILTVKDKAPVSTGVTAKLSSSVASGSVPLAVHFDASLSKPKTGSSIDKIELNLGNGYIALDKLNPVYDFTFATEGEYQAILKVTDVLGDVAYAVLNISALGDENNNLDRNYGYWISFPQGLNIKYANGQQAQISGDICKIWKTQSNMGSCQWVDKQRIQIRAFFPDMTREVSSLLNVTTTNEKRNFTFQSPTLSKNNLNVLTLLVGEIDPTSIQFGALKSKLEMRIMVLDQKIIDYENDGVSEEVLKVLREVRATLVSLADKIDHRNAKVPSTLAQYNLPLQVDNRVSAGRYYSTMVGGFRYELSSDIGNLYQGDYANIKSRVTNINYVPDNTYDLEGYNLKYKYKNALKTTQFRPSFAKGEVHEYIFQDSTKSNLTDFYNFGVEIEEKFKWWSRSLGSSEFSMPVMEDTEAPYWVNPQTEILYTTHLPIFSEKAIDNFGRLDRGSFKAILSGQTSADITSLFSFESTSGGTDYAIRADLRTQFATEGQYELTYTIADFEGHKADPEPYVRKYHVDRTPPFIMLPFADTHSTNEVSFELPLTIADMSPFRLKVYVNGVLAEEADAPAGSLNDALAVDLVEGINLVRVEAVDIVGNSSVVNYPAIMLDTTPPVLASINLENGQLVRTQEFTIQGQGNEFLKSVIINGTEIELGEDDTKNFAETITLLVDGEQRVNITLTDLAGNTSEYSIGYHFLLRLIDGNLINVALGDEEGKLKIIGHQGATRPNLEITAEDGFFNDDEVTANADGSFELTLDTFTYAKVTAYDPSRDRSESVIVNFRNDTTLAGNVRDTDDNPLAGVTVRIVSSGQTAITDASGTFAIPNPALGDQTITIDGRTISPEITNGEKEFSVITMNVSLGNEQKNIIERTIYLSPKYLDGTETEIIAGSGAVVSSPHAEGVMLEIPSNAATFPGGGKNGTINIVEIPVSKTSIEVLEAAEPEKVYALEPSGLKFNQPVKLTLPNNNDFPVGTELVILSKNSTTGNWEVDGAAKVTDGNVIETKDGMGITHFSDVYAAPLGMDIKPFNDGDKPSFDNLNGSVSSSIGLPSFKAMGQSIAPILVYNSQWANPNIVISNIFDLPRRYYEMSFSQSQGNWTGSAKVSATIQTWITPDHIDAQFTTGSLTSEKIRFTGMPDKSLVSYQVDLSSLDSGIHPAKSSYEVKFKELTIRTVKTKTKSLWGTKTTTQSWKDEKILEDVFPQELVSTIYHQNKKDSELGAGWRLNYGKRILNPAQDRIMVEKETGEVAAYSLKNTVETVQHDNAGIRSFTTDGNIVFAVNTNGEVLRSTTVSDSQTVMNLPPYQGKYGVNTSWYQTWTRRCTKSGWSGCKKHEYSYYYSCNKYDVDYSFQRKVKSMMFQNGQLVYLDQLGAVWGVDPIFPIAGYFDVPNSYTVASNAGAEQDYQTQCQGIGKENCSTVRNGLNSYTIKVVEGPTNNLGWCNQPAYCYSGNCTNTWKGSSGKIPHSGMQDGALSYSKFNQPTAITAGPIPDSILVADYGNNLVRLVDTVSGNVSTFAGNQDKLDNGDDGAATSASIFHPRGLLMLEDGSVLISSETGYIRRVTTDGKISHYAGKPTSKGGIFTDITAMENVALSSPSAMVLDKENNYLYVADTGHNRILRLDLNIEEARVVAGNGTCGVDDVFEGKAALDVSLCRPEQIALDSNGNLLVLDEANKRVRKVNFSSPENGAVRYQPVASDNSEVIRNQDGTFVLTLRNGDQSLFSAEGLELETLDRVGRSTVFNYDGDKRLTKVELPTGQEITVSYSGSKISSITDPAGRTTTFSHSDGLLTHVTYPDGTERSFDYSEKGVLLEETNQRGFKTRYIVNRWERLTQIIAPDGSSSSMDDAISKTIANDNTNGNSSQLLSYESDSDALNDVISDASGSEASFKRDTLGYIQTVSDADGNVTKIERDSQGRTVKIIRPDMSYTEMTYDNATGDLTKRFDSANNISEEYVYNSYGQLTQYKDQQGNVRVTDYAPNGLILKQSDSNGSSLQYTYNSLGLPLTNTNQLGATVSYSYDSAGNHVQVTSAGGQVTSYTRDNAGNIISETNARGYSTQKAYDLFNRVTSVKLPNNALTTYSYLPTGEISSIINAEGFEQKFEYTEAGKVSKKISPKNEVTQLFYNNKGLLSREISPRGDEILYNYNEKNQLVQRVLPDNTYNYTHDDEGNLVHVSNNTSSFDLSYVEIQKEFKLSSIQSSVDGVGNYTISYQYNSLGHRLSMSSNFISLNYGYNSLNKLSSLSNSLGQNFSFSYDIVGRLQSINFPNDIQSVVSFDVNSNLVGLHHKKSSTTIENLNYGRDNVGNFISASSTSGTKNFSYDELNQLVGATNTEATTGYGVESFSYDKVGNRTGSNLGNYDYGDKKYRLDEDFQYLYVYDLSGNLTSKQKKGMDGDVWNYTYSSENQLIRVEYYVGATKLRDIQYFYDAMGRRVRKHVQNIESSTEYERNYVYDVEEIIAELDENGTILARYTQSGLRTDDTLSVDITSTGASKGLATNFGRYFYFKDNIGSVAAISSENGQLIQKYIYSSYGKLLKKVDASGLETSAFNTSYTFTNREYDEESGLYYLRARYYDPEVGRFTTQDPDAGEIGNPITHSTAYSYVGNNPVGRTDPSGQMFEFSTDFTWESAAYYGASWMFGSNGVPGLDYGKWCGWQVRPAEKGSDPEPIDRLDSQCRKHDYDLLIVANRPSIWEDGYEIPGINQMVASTDFAIYYASRIYVDTELAFNMLNHNNWDGKPIANFGRFVRSIGMSAMFFYKAFTAATFTNVWDSGAAGASWLFSSSAGQSFIDGNKKIVSAILKLASIKLTW